MQHTRFYKFLSFPLLLASILVLWFEPLTVLGTAFLIALNVAVYVILRNHASRQSLYLSTIKTCEERYKAFIENSVEGIWRFELSKPMDITLSEPEQVAWLQKYGRYAECNKKFLDMCGKEAIVGLSLSTPISKNLMNEVFLKAFVKKNYNLRNLENVETLKGETYVFLTNVFGVVENGRLVRGWGKQTDMTDTRRIEKEKALLLKKAQDSQTLIDLATREKDKVLANLSHELRTPLVSIVGYSEILNKDTPKDELEKGLEVINRNGKQQLALIEELLSLSKTLSGKSKLNKESFNLRALINEQLESLKYKHADKAIKIMVEEKDVHVYTDKQKVTQIFNNLFSNAIKFTDKGYVKVGYGLGEGNSFYLSVEDTGLGMEEQDLVKLFKPYYQIKDGRDKSKAGVGLGLYIVKRFVNLLKGRVEVESKLGVGTKMTVLLPLNGNDLRQLGASLDGLHILLVEDDHDIGELTKIILERDGSLVTWVTRAKEAREVLKEDVFDLYLFDVAMPEEDGISLIKSLRSLEDNTPAVALSAYDEYETEATQHGFTAFVHKPVTLDKLRELINVLF